ncbi:MAG: SAM-dependent methyltransferase [Acidimicrobiales bacterium]
MTVARFDAWMERCLYHPEHGFYGSGAGRAGRRRGDFITSPEVGPLFADVLAAAVDAWWEEAGRPDPFLVVDAGTGPGTLARALAAAPGASAGARRVIGADRAGPTAPAGSTVDPLAGTDLAGAVVIANELLDNLPFRVVERRAGGWYELYVEGEPGPGAGAGIERWEPIDDPGLDVPVGARAPWLEQASRWVSDVLAQGPAALLVLDYGAPTTAELAGRGGWLRTYRQHERGSDPLAEPGQWDITTDVAVDQLPGAPEVTTQAELLRRWGIDALVDQGRRYWAEHAARPDLTALRMRSRVSEAEALLDPAGLGGWLACLWRSSPPT